jgi:hypothetical protein
MCQNIRRITRKLGLGSSLRSVGGQTKSLKNVGCLFIQLILFNYFSGFWLNHICDQQCWVIRFQHVILTATGRRRHSSGCDMDTAAFRPVKYILILYSADSLLITTLQFLDEQYPFIIIRHLTFLFSFWGCCDKILIVHSMFFSIYWLRQTLLSKSTDSQVNKCSNAAASTVSTKQVYELHFNPEISLLVFLGSTSHQSGDFGFMCTTTKDSIFHFHTH